MNARRNKMKRKRRLAFARSKGTHTNEEWERMLSILGGLCVKCGADDCHLDKDHIIPLHCGGSDSILNIQPLCAWCNCGKSSQPTDYRGEALPPEWRLTKEDGPDFTLEEIFSKEEKEKQRV